VGEFLVSTARAGLHRRKDAAPADDQRTAEKANKAASSFASGILREPLNGVDAICQLRARRGCGCCRRAQ
jgi:hypothetical protein